MPTQNGIRQLEPPTCDDRLMWDIESSAFHAPALSVADELGIFALLEQKPATAQEVAASLSLGMRAVEALLATLTALGLLVQHRGEFSNSETARNYLLPDSPYYWGDFLRQIKHIPRTHAAILEVVRNDTLRDNPSQWLQGDVDPERARQFTEVMHSRGLPPAFGVARRGDFSGVKRLLDVAGGSGCFSIAMAMRYPEMRFTILELPSVCAHTNGYIAEYGLQFQIDTHAADMFNDPWPGGYDAVFFSEIFHDWDREHCLALGRRSFTALPPGGRIYLHEMLMAETQDGPLTIAACSMRMLLMTQGKQYSAVELGAILRECGFVDVSVTSTSTYFSLVSARKP
jgi:hypothetical protein